jgi:predicted NBD/HSP70 family sugar kinase
MQTPGTGRGRNSVQLRRYNERLLLHILRRAGEASKADLARRARLTGTAVSSIVGGLEEEGLVEYTGRRLEGHRGQPASLIRLNPKGAYGIGVRLDRDSIETALMDFGGELLARRTHNRVLPRPEEALAIVNRDIERLLAAVGEGERRRIAGVGVAQPYNLGSWLRELGLPAETFRPWDEFDFPRELGALAGLPAFGENDGNAAAIAELFYGCGRRHDDFIYLFLGPAIGCGIALNGDCLRGVSGNAGDIAVMPVPPSRLDSARTPDGKWDILLSRASLNALARHLRHAGAKIETHTDIESYIESRHAAVDEWIDDCIDALSPVVRSALCILDVPTVVFDADLDGGLVDTLIRRLGKSLADTAPEARGVPTLLRGSFGSDAGAIGAASLPMFFSFSPRVDLLREAAIHTEEAEHVR